MSKTIIVSDIHIGRRDSHIKELYETIVNEPSDIIVLNGNIFDQFALWKDRGELYQKEHHKYVKMLFTLLKERKTKIIYLIGNHDYLGLVLIPFGFIWGIKIRKKPD